MSVIDEHLASLDGAERAVVSHIYDIVRQLVPTATEEIYYALPAFKYKGDGLLAIAVTKHHLSLYPFCAVERLGLDLSGFETTSGSIHFRPEQPLPDELVRDIITSRLQLIGRS